MTAEAREQELLVQERALQEAQRTSDVAQLERLLHPRLLAVGPDGAIADRAADLDGHRTGLFRIEELHEEELRTLLLDDVAVTFVLVRLRGTIGDADASGRLRYTRTWTRDGGTWRVLAAHIAVVGPL